MFVKEYEEAKKSNPNIDVVIIGKTGQKWAKDRLNGVKIYYFDLSDNSIDPLKLSDVFDFVSKYEDITVFHGVFENILSQVPTKSPLLGEIDKVKEELPKKRSLGFIFEPSIIEIKSYFENQVKLLLFEQLVNEYNLSKYSSRMINLDDSSQRILKRTKTLERYMKKYKHKRLNESVISKSAMSGRVGGFGEYYGGR